MEVSQKSLAHVFSRFFVRSKWISGARNVDANLWWVIVTGPPLMGSLGCFDTRKENLGRHEAKLCVSNILLNMLKYFQVSKAQLTTAKANVRCF